MDRGHSDGPRVNIRRPPPLTDSELLGCMAYDLTLLLNVEVDEWRENRQDQGQEWLPSDDGTLHHMADFEDHVTNFCIEPAMPAEQRPQLRGGLNLGLAAYHDALPFSGAERRWITDTLRGIPKKERRARQTIVSQEAAEIMVAGVRRVTKGTDLTRRWWAWRRQTDEFEGQGSFDATICALDSIAMILMRKPRPSLLEERIEDHLTTK